MKDGTEPTVAWLVECPKYHPGEYFALCECGCGRHHWTKDVHAASKFPTKEAAETARGGDTNCIAIEHVFGLTLPTEPTVSSERPVDALARVFYESGISSLLERERTSREQGQAEGFAAAVQWLRDRAATKPPAALWHEASLLADQMEQSRKPGSADISEDA